ncbi:MAG: type II secretion system F family protein, partial [Patescibacteria group bacterium]
INWWWLMILITFFLISLVMGYLKTPEGKNVKSELIMKIPIFGNLFKKIYVARFADSLSILIRGGIPVAQSIEITGHTIDNIIYRDILHEVSEKIKAGETLSVLLSANEYYFPAMVGQMVAVGETTGRLEEILTKISVFYTRDVDNTLNNLAELIQPVLITVIGIFIGLLFAAVLLPIYNLMQGFKTF